MLSLFARDQYNTQSIEASYFNNFAMRTQLWELISYGASNFLQSIWLITEAASRGALQEKVFLEILQNSQENTNARVSSLIKLQASGLRPAAL